MIHRAFESTEVSLSDEVLLRLREWGEKTRPSEDLLGDENRISATIRVLYQDGSWCLDEDNYAVLRRADNE